MQDNYIQPASHDLLGHNPIEHDVRHDVRHDTHNEPEPLPPAGGEPIVMPIIEPVTSSRRRVRRTEKEKNDSK